MTALYRCLLRLYPAAHRRDFADEMLAVYCAAEADAAGDGILRHSLFLAREAAGLVHGAIGEQLHALLGAHWRLLARPGGSPCDPISAIP